MKLFFFFALLSALISCSFDQKSGIWTNENNISDKNKLFKDFKDITTKTHLLIKKFLSKNYKFKQIQRVNNYEWKDVFYDKTNNYKNFTIMIIIK